jgi:sporulation protein YlmC with PRC-barrel domain
MSQGHQDPPPTVAAELAVIEMATLAPTYPAKELIGCDVVNDQGETIGQIDDLLIRGDTDKVAFAIVSVGGFLGLGAHRVVVDFADLAIGSDVVLHGATKDKLKSLLAYDPHAARDQRLPVRRPRRGVKETGKAVRTAFGEPIPGGVADVTDEDE